MRSKVIIISLLLAFISPSFLSCKSSKNTSNKGAKEIEIDASKVSTEVSNFLRDQKAGKPLESLVNNYKLQEKEGIYYLSGLAKMKEGADPESLRSYGVHIGTEAGNIWTVSIPIDRLSEVVMMDDLLYLERKKVTLK